MQSLNSKAAGAPYVAVKPNQDSENYTSITRTGRAEFGGFYAGITTRGLESSLITPDG